MGFCIGLATVAAVVVAASEFGVADSIVSAAANCCSVAIGGALLWMIGKEGSVAWFASHGDVTACIQDVREEELKTQ